MTLPLVEDRLLAATDAALLRQIGAVQPGSTALDDLLDEALVVPVERLPADAVRLGAVVELEDVASGRRQTLVPCEPALAAPAAGRISVLSPAGVALIGLRAGATARWFSPGGGHMAARLIAVHPPPEA